MWPRRIPTAPAAVVSAATVPSAFTYGALALWAAALLYLLPGILGHGPWKQDETYTFGIVDDFLRTGHWLIPTNAGQPFMEKPPLFMWTAKVLASLFSSVLPLHDGARLATALYGGVTLAFSARAAQAVFSASRLNDSRVVGTVALLAGTLLMVKNLHDLFSDVALVAGTAIGLASLLRIVRHVSAIDETKPRGERSALTAVRQRGTVPIGDVVGFGVGVAIASMSKGLFVPAIFLLTAVTVGLVHPHCRHRVYARAVSLAVLCCLPLALLWPLLLYRAAPSLFFSWFWDNNVGRFLGFSVAELGSDNERGFVIKAALSSCFPVGPLVFAGLVLGGWRRLRDPALLTAFVFGAFGLAVLSLSATARQLYLMPFVLPGALLAADTWQRVPHRLSSAWDLGSRVLFGMAAAVIWGAWWVMQQPVDAHRPLAFVGKWLPLDYLLSPHPIEIAAAVALTAGWMALLPTLRRQTTWRGPLSWAAGVTLTWGLMSTLLLPWLDQAKSYGPVFTALQQALRADWSANDCMASRYLGESEAPMLYYYADILHRPIGLRDATSCRWLIVQGRMSKLAESTPEPEWHLFWTGARHGDSSEVLRVYRR